MRPERQEFNRRINAATHLQRNVVIVGVLLTVVLTLVSAVSFGAVTLGRLSAQADALTDIGNTNKNNGQVTRDNANLLVDCVTPGDAPPPTTGHKCWDTLHDPEATDSAVAVIVDDLYCDQRRAQAKMPPVPDPRLSCRSQTPAGIYPGAPPTVAP